MYPSQDDPALRRHSIVLGFAVFLLLISFTIYGIRSDSFGLPKNTYSYRPTLTNPEILQNWLPASAVTYTVSRIDDYLQTHNMYATAMIATSKVIPSSASYDFTIALQPYHNSLDISLTVINYGDNFSTAVTINGDPQTPTVPGAQPSATSNTTYSGFTDLVSAGVTALQSNELEQAVQVFDSGVHNVTISAGTITADPSITQNNDFINTYHFSIGIGSKTYRGTLKCINLNQARLILVDPTTNKQVFDSGVISQGI